MTNNLLRKCENCVYGSVTGESLVKGERVLLCTPKLPTWVYGRLDWGYAESPVKNYVYNSTANKCEAFRMRDVGEN